jgi:hypothetical protein
MARSPNKLILKYFRSYMGCKDLRICRCHECKLSSMLVFHIANPAVPSAIDLVEIKYDGSRKFEVSFLVAQPYIQIEDSF